MNVACARRRQGKNNCHKTCRQCRFVVVVVVAVAIIVVVIVVLVVLVVVFVLVLFGVLSQSFVDRLPFVISCIFLLVSKMLQHVDR